MDIQASELKALEATARALLAAIESLSKPIEVPPDVASRVAKLIAQRICLGCGESFPKPERYTRGRCGACYNTLVKRIERGPGTWREAIEKGELAPEKQSPGRVAKMDIKAAKADARAIESEANASKKTKPKKGDKT